MKKSWITKAWPFETHFKIAIAASLLIAIYWAFQGIFGHGVPSTTEIVSGFGKYTMPFSVSRWWDVLFVVPSLLTSVLVFRNIKKMFKESDSLADPTFNMTVGGIPTASFYAFMGIIGWQFGLLPGFVFAAIAGLVAIPLSFLFFLVGACLIPID